MSAAAQPATTATKPKRKTAAPKLTTELPRGAFSLAVASDRPQIGPRKLFICTYNSPWNDIFDPGSGIRKFWFKGGRACVSGETLIDTPSGKIPVKDFRGGDVYSWDGDKIIVATACKPCRYTKENLYRVLLESGKSILVTDQHRFLTKSGWKMTKDLTVGETLVSASSFAFDSSSQDCSSGPSQVQTTSSCFQKRHCGEFQQEYSEDVLHSIRKLLGLLYRYWQDFRQCDGLPQTDEDTYLDVVRRLACVRVHIRSNLHMDGLERGVKCTQETCGLRHSKQDCLLCYAGKYCEDSESEILRMLSELLSATFPSALQCLETEDLDGSIRQVSRHLLLSIEGLDSSEDGLSSAEFSCKVCHTESDSLRMLFDTLRRTVHDTSLAESFHYKLDIINRTPHYIIMDKVVEVRFDKKEHYYDLFVPFYNSYFAEGILNHNSFKSTFISEAIALGMEADGQKALQEKKRGNPAWKRYLTHAVVYRKYGVDIHDSVFTQFKVTVTDILGHGPLWHFAKTGRRAVYLPTGQQIVFRGLDDAQKQKSIKAPFGFFKYLWFEEATEYAGVNELRSVEQSVQRGGHRFLTFASYNPPRNRRDWVNEAAAAPMEGRKVYHSTFLDAAKYAPEWLGPDFFRDARALLALDEEAFRHEYLGEITGTGAEVFKRLKSRTITQEDLQSCGVRRFGLDFGFEGDPTALVSCGYDAKRRILYIYREWVKKGQFEEQISAAIKAQGLSKKIIYADNSEPRSIARLQILGCHGVQKCDKSPSTNSVEDGLHWLQSLRAIVIDPHTCPVSTREFSRYEYKKDKDGRSTGVFMDLDNHTIDAVRYAMQNEIKYGDNMAKWNRV